MLTQCYIMRLMAVLALAGASIAVMPASGATPGESVPPLSTNTPGTLHALQVFEKQTRNLLKRVAPCTVKVGGGSGVVISPEGYVLTVAHVGQDSGRRVTVTFPDGKRVQGETLGNNHGIDAGLVKLRGDGPWPYVDMGRSTAVAVGQWCVALGYPVSFEAGQPPALRIGRVLLTTDQVVMSDCAIMGGDSGGPLFDMNGRVIGISSRCDHVLGHNFHVPVDTYRETWDRLVGGEVWNPWGENGPFLGVSPARGTDEARLGRVLPDTAAEEAGLRAGDVVIAFDGKTIEDYAGLASAIRKRKPGETVSMEIRRDGKTHVIQLVLGKRGEYAQ